MLTELLRLLAAATIVLVSVAPTTVRSSSLSSNSLLGASPEDDKYYRATSEFIKCKDGLKKILRAQLNDDFCDCPDGSDEPGTSACPNARFYCHNAGHIPLVIFSSRVNDGICDCCDGSDEHNGNVKCPNTCWEAGKVARDKLQKKIATYKEGVSLRKQEIERAKQAFSKDEAELSKLKKEEKILKDLVEQLKERQEQIEKAEEKERLEKKKEERIPKEVNEQEQGNIGAREKIVIENEKSVQGTHDDAAWISEDQGDETSYKDLEDEHSDHSEIEGSPSRGAELVKDKDEGVTASSESGTDYKGEPETVSSEATEALSKEELGRIVASRWTGEDTGLKNSNADSAKDNSGSEEIPENGHEEEYDGYASEVDDDNQSYDDNDAENQIDDDFTEEDQPDSSSSYGSDSEDDSLLSASSNLSWLERIQRTVRNLLRTVKLLQNPLDTSDADRIRKEYEEGTAKLSKLQSRISSLSEKLKHDFGPEKEFYPFYGRCFETQQSKYVYKVCPFKQATQIEGHSNTRLGRWEKFDESYKVMLFSNGDRCWNGPDRSLKVKLRCGLKNEINDIDEPSRCEYVALLSTPSVCLEEKLKELEHKLVALSKQKPMEHDEL